MLASVGVTVAVCTKCGGRKHGAWTPCPGCQYDPSGQGLVEEARALYLTDHYRSLAELDAAGAAIREGQIPAVDEAFVASLVTEAQARGRTTLIPKVRIGIACGALLLVAAALVFAVVRGCS